MPLDRQAIEKRDFPIARRGYDPAAVDAHLARLADELEALQRQLRRRTGESLAQTASEQVRAIVEAAESSASAIERAAEDEALQIRTEAARDAERTRADAIERAQGHVGSVAMATGELLTRVEAMQGELGTLVATLRTGANRVNADLTLLESNLGDLHAAVGSGDPRDRDAEDDQPHGDAVPFEAEAEAEADEAPAVDGGDVEGARLIALNMALDGQHRHETDRYLAENFELPDRDRLLDEVYASIEG